MSVLIAFDDGYVAVRQTGRNDHQFLVRAELQISCLGCGMGVQALGFCADLSAFHDCNDCSRADGEGMTNGFICECRAANQVAQ